MKINPQPGLVLVKKHQRTALKADIAIEENDDDKRLITGEVIAGKTADFPKGTTVIFGKYALYKLTVKGEDFYLLDEKDILGTCDYKE